MNYNGYTVYRILIKPTNTAILGIYIVQKDEKHFVGPDKFTVLYIIR